MRAAPRGLVGSGSAARGLARRPASGARGGREGGGRGILSITTVLSIIAVLIAVLIPIPVPAGRPFERRRSHDASAPLPGCSLVRREPEVGFWTGGTT